MLSSKTVLEMARGMPGVSEKSHFGSDGLSANKRMFATVWHSRNEVNLRLSPETQKSFLKAKPEAYFQIPNAWGRQGWTTVRLKFVDRKSFAKALEAAWENSAVKAARRLRS